MPVFKQKSSVDPGRNPASSLAIASLMACMVIGACRLITHVTSFERTELDGIVFLAGLFWALSVIGYLAPYFVRKDARRDAGSQRQILDAPLQSGQKKISAQRYNDRTKRPAEAVPLAPVAFSARVQAMADHCG